MRILKILLNYRIENCDWAKRINKVKTIKLATKNFPSEFLAFLCPEQAITIRPRDKPWFDTTVFETKHSRQYE